jgi:hypothetical protein
MTASCHPLRHTILTVRTKPHHQLKPSSFVG